MNIDDPGYRSLVLTKEKGLPKLEQRIRRFPGPGGVVGRLKIETLKAKSGLSGNTILSVRTRRKGVHFSTLECLFQALKLTLEGDDYERWEKEPLPSEREQNKPGDDLPHPISSFIGRTNEIEDVISLLGATRLLTVTGFGGCGKTRLALHVAAKIRGHYNDGVFLVRLEALSDGSLIPQQIMSSLGLSEQSRQTVLDTVTAYLKDKKILLILDNCEHLINQCASIAESLLQSCGDLTLLTTSREPLKISGEQIWRILPLPFPNPDRLPQLESDLLSELMKYDACSLFIERAKDHEADLQWDRQSGYAVAEICAQLEGIPLAIELAAAYVRVMSVQQIAERLKNRFRLLGDAPRNAPPRQQTLKAMIDWSYELLSKAERTFLGRLSVFAGGWTSEAVEQVCAGEGENDVEVIALLLSLTDKSLVVTGAAKDRYRLLETVRQYGRERLAESGESKIIQERHRDYFLALAEAADPELKGAAQVKWLQRLDEDYDDLRVALELSLLESELSVNLRLCGALTTYWEIRGYLTEGRSWCKSALEKADVQEQPSMRAKVLNGAGILARCQCDFLSAQTYFEESLTIRTEIEDQSGIAALLNNLGLLARAKGDNVSARKYLKECLAVFREIGDQRSIGVILGNLGLVADAEDDRTAARELYEESLTIFREIGDQSGIATALNNLGIIAEAQGDYAEACRKLEESLTIFREIGDRSAIAVSLMGLGGIMHNHGDYADARPKYEESLAIFQAIEDPRGIAYSLEAFAELAANVGKTERASVLWGAAAILRETIGSPLETSQQASYDASVVVVRKMLGETAFKAAWTAGRTMTTDQATKYALEDPRE